MIENDDQQKKWDRALLGESAPNSDDPIELRAHTVRQLILWESTQTEKNLIPPHQASRFYKQIQRTNRKRKWMKMGIFSVLGLLMAVSAYFLVQPTVIDRSNKRVSIDSKNFTTQNTILDFPYMVTIPAGTYTMGCENGWDDKLGSCSSSEKPPHEVNVKKFALSKYETTLGQFKKFIAETDYLSTAEIDNAGCTVSGEVAGKVTEWVLSKNHNWKNPGFEQHDKHPVTCISWSDTQAYIAWLSKKTGIQYRLPTEEEWEYSARARKITMYHWGEVPDRNYANYRGVGETDEWKYTSPVGELAGNDFGLHDISGNVWEWVENCWRPNYRSGCSNENTKTRRGGSWFDAPRNIRSAYRGSHTKDARSFLHGFRIAHDLD